jgi:HSP20 family protein
MDDFVARSFGYTPFSRLADAAAWAPPIEFQENAQAYLLRAYLPGMSQEDLNLEVTGDRISLSGERRRTPTEEGVKIHSSTIPYGRFQLAYELPVQIRADEAKASFRDGVLEVVLPKVEEARTRTVKVNIE